jgi:hypothetical protein
LEKASAPGEEPLFRALVGKLKQETRWTYITISSIMMLETPVAALYLDAAFSKASSPKQPIYLLKTSRDGKDK